VRAGFEEPYVTNPKIRVLAPHDVAQLPGHSLDVIVLHSVAQYFTAPDADVLFAMFRPLLNDGLVRVSDVIPPDVGPLSDAWALLRFAEANGYLFAALGGLLRTFFPITGSRPRASGLSRYSEDAMLPPQGRMALPAAARRSSRTLSCA
jgi:hypothetical protein